MYMKSGIFEKIGREGMIERTGKEASALAKACEHPDQLENILHSLAGLMVCLTELSDNNVFAMESLDVHLIRRKAAMEVEYDV